VCLGDGAYSEVYKVKRNSDSQIYALKKVTNLPNAHSLCVRVPFHGARRV